MKKTIFWFLMGLLSVSGTSASLHRNELVTCRTKSDQAFSTATSIVERATRTTFIRDLKALFSALESGSGALIDKYVFPTLSDEELSEMPSIIEKREISLEGILILEEEGAFGPLEEIWPHKFQTWLSRNDLQSADECYSMRLGVAEVAGIWNGTHFEFFRIDDVGKLTDY